MLRKFLSKLVYILLILAVITPIQPVLAVNQFYSSNDILFYDENDNGCADGFVVTNTLSLQKSDELEAIFQSLINGGMNSVQAAAVMGNMMQESGFSSSIEESNGIGYGLAQWSFGRRTALEDYAVSKSKDVSDVNLQLEFLLKEYNDTYKKMLKGSEFETANNISGATEAWMMIYERPAMNPANDPAGLYSVRVPAAQKVYEFYNGISPSQGLVISSNCSNGAIAGNIVETAVNFAQTFPVPNGNISKADARDTYQIAKEQLNSGGEWSDCGVFVATVMIASGVDPDYPKIGVANNQEPYVRDHPEKYKIIESIRGVNDLQPGDILITSSHTIIYTGKSDYPAVDASLNQRVPGVLGLDAIDWMVKHDTIVARVIK
jgi:hypothetical protein